MKTVITLAALCGLLLFVADANAGKVKCKDGSCSVSTKVDKAQTATVAKTVEQSAVTTTKEKRVRRHGLHLRLPKVRLPKLFCRGCG